MSAVWNDTQKRFIQLDYGHIAKMGKETWEVRIDRQSVLGNPFYMSDESKRDEVCDKYAVWLREKIDTQNKEVCDELNRIYKITMKWGKVKLYCWCYPKRCHAQEIIKVLEKVIR